MCSIVKCSPYGGQNGFTSVLPESRGVEYELRSLDSLPLFLIFSYTKAGHFCLLWFLTCAPIPKSWLTLLTRGTARWKEQGIHICMFGLCYRSSARALYRS